mmetsp:Transcript_18510/g.58053  ORF Transcript_18510/g.58053 Transcript_18510/m.58053 type:complete len:423 (-) Transcript_18510:42-1310(-)
MMQRSAYISRKWCCMVAFSKTSWIRSSRCSLVRNSMSRSFWDSCANFSIVSLLRMDLTARATSWSPAWAAAVRRKRCCAAQDVGDAWAILGAASSLRSRLTGASFCCTASSQVPRDNLFGEAWGGSDSAAPSSFGLASASGSLSGSERATVPHVVQRSSAEGLSMPVMLELAASIFAWNSSAHVLAPTFRISSPAGRLARASPAPRRSASAAASAAAAACCHEGWKTGASADRADVGRAAGPPSHSGMAQRPRTTTAAEVRRACLRTSRRSLASGRPPRAAATASACTRACTLTIPPSATTCCSAGLRTRSSKLRNRTASRPGCNSTAPLAGLLATTAASMPTEPPVRERRDWQTSRTLVSNTKPSLSQHCAPADDCSQRSSSGSKQPGKAAAMPAVRGRKGFGGERRIGKGWLDGDGRGGG